MKTPIALLTLALLCLPVHAAVTLHVAPDGNDAWSGQLKRPNAAKSDGPLATPQGARDAARKLKAAGQTERVTVEFQPGTYQMAAPVALDAKDSGVEYRALPGTVRISGGRQIGGFAPVTDEAIVQRLPEAARGQVVQTDLKAQGITDFGKLSRRGFGKAIVESHLELFFNDQPMTLARWPNADEKEPYTRVTAVPEGKDGLTFGVDDALAARLPRWEQEKEPWVFGYWYFDWADEYIPVAKVDPAAKTLTLQEPKPNYGMRLKQRFYGLNLLCELDQPGEWYLDRASGVLYFWPPSPLEKGQAYVSIAPSLFNLKDASDVTLRGFIFEGARGTAISVSNGTRDKIVACTLRNLGNRAVSIGGGSQSGVAGCDVYNCGDGGLSLSGGDRKTLTPCGHFAENNHIHDYSRWSRTYRPAIGVGGDGVRVAHNLLHDGQHNAIQLGGNDHVIEFNEIHSVAYDTGDVGAFYMGRDWTARGTVIRHNYFHHIKGPGTYGAMGVYLDDQASGINIYGNVFYEVTRAVFIGGGDDNVVDNNVFVNCAPSVHIDARGMGWQKKATDDPQGELRRYLAAMPYQNELWRQRYPQLVNVLEDDPGAPKRNLVTHNVCVGGKWDDVEKKGAEWQIFKDNLVNEDPKLARPLPKVPRAVDFALQKDSPAFALGFKALPLEEIGLQKSDERASWPAVHTPRALPQDQEAMQPGAAHGPAPIFKVARAQGAPTIDGAIVAAEWNGANVKAAMTVEQGIEGEKVTLPSTAWIFYDDKGLLVAVDNATDPNANLKKGNQWGENDAMELAIRPGDTKAPVLVYRGFASGHWLVSDENGTPAAAIEKARAGVQYAARAVEQGRWSAEWRIPWTALGLSGPPAPGTKWPFNLSVRKVAGDLWVMWHGTGGNSYLVERAGVLEF